MPLQCVAEVKLLPGDPSTLDSGVLFRFKTSAATTRIALVGAVAVILLGCSPRSVPLPILLCFLFVKSIAEKRSWFCACRREELTNEFVYVLHAKFIF